VRTSGITADGLFKMQMWLSGIGTPDATYGVSCYPANGTALNLHHHQPWTRSKRRLLTPADGGIGKCYNYMAVLGDTLAAVVDHFGVDMRQVRDHLLYDIYVNLRLWQCANGRCCAELVTPRCCIHVQACNHVHSWCPFEEPSDTALAHCKVSGYPQVVHDKANRGVVGQLIEYKYAFGANLKAEELTMAMTTVNSVTSGFAATPARVQCSHYDALGSRRNVTCTVANATACSQPGEKSLISDSRGCPSPTVVREGPNLLLACNCNNFCCVIAIQEDLV
jgi:hypothetical protein